MDTSIFKGTNPKTLEDFEIWVTPTYSEKRSGDPYGSWTLKAYPWGEEAPAAGRAILIGYTGRGRMDYLEIHSIVRSQWRGEGVGTLLYLAAAIYAAKLGGLGIHSLTRSDSANELWDRLIAEGVAVSEPPYRYLTARAARSTKLIKYLGRYGPKFRDYGAS